MKDRVLTWGDLASRLKGRRGNLEREVSRDRSSQWRAEEAETTGKEPKGWERKPDEYWKGKVSDVRESEAPQQT